MTKGRSFGPEITAGVKKIDGSSDYGDVKVRLDIDSFTMTRIIV